MKFRLIIPPYCPHCHHPINPGENYRMCYTCNRQRSTIPDRAYDAARSGTLYIPDRPNSESAYLVAAKNDRRKCRSLAELVTSAVLMKFPAYELADWLVPVPTTATKLRERGFNHAEEIALGISNLFHRPVVPALEIERDPEASQHELNAEDRLSNVDGCYRVGAEARLAGKRVILVDNIYTTGATVIECSRTLKAGGARGVLVATAGRSLLTGFAASFCGGYFDD